MTSQTPEPSQSTEAVTGELGVERQRLISIVELWDCGDLDSFARVLDRIIGFAQAAARPEPPVEGALEEATCDRCGEPQMAWRGHTYWKNRADVHAFRLHKEPKDGDILKEIDRLIEGAAETPHHPFWKGQADGLRKARALIVAARSGHDGLEALFEEVYGAAQWLGAPTIEDGEGPNQAAHLLNLAVNRLAILTGRDAARALSPEA